MFILQLLSLLAQMNLPANGSPFDLDGNGIIQTSDLIIFLGGGI